MSNVYKIHFLKIVQPFFGDILSGQKTFEIRFNDRNFMIGDTILLYEWDNVKQAHSGEALWFKLRYMLNTDTVPSLPLKLVVMSVADYVRVHDFTPYDKHGDMILALQGEDLSCDQCGSAHVDEKEWSLRPHKTHLCGNCDQEFEGSRKAVSHPVFKRGADLSGTKLSGTKLSDADLSYADLSGANLSGADLSDAILSGANLSKAKLRGSNLSYAVLNAVNLSGADLSGADLRGADLRGANLSDAKLSDANLSDAKLSGTIIDGYVLS